MIPMNSLQVKVIKEEEAGDGKENLISYIFLNSWQFTHYEEKGIFGEVNGKLLHCVSDGLIATYR